MEQYKEYFAYEIAGYPVWDLVVAIVIFAGVYIALIVAKQLVLSRLEKLAGKTKLTFDDAAIKFLKDIKQIFYILIALYIALRGFVFADSVQLVFDIIFMLAIVSQVIRLIEAIIGAALEKKFRNEDGTSSLPGVFSIFIRLILWTVGGLLILQNLGVNVTSLIAGLGIGGLAISLALQGVLSDLFSSFSIAIDKPFEQGDFIVIGEHKGTVKHIGLKTTRIQALQGEEIVISNTELTSARVQNFKKMEKRRILFTIGVTYETPKEKLLIIDDIVKKIIESKEHVEFDRIHFNEFGESNLNFQIVYYMLTSDYVVYMDTQQAINIEILGEFEKEGIEMAFPTRTVYLKKEE